MRVHVYMCVNMYISISYLINSSKSYLDLHLPFLILFIDWKRKSNLSKCLLSTSYVLSCIFNSQMISQLWLNCYKGIKHSFSMCWRNFRIKIWINVSVWRIQVLGWFLWTVLNLTSKHLLKSNVRSITLLRQWRIHLLMLPRMVQFTPMTVRTSAACTCYLRAWFYVCIFKA